MSAYLLIYDARAIQYESCMWRRYVGVGVGWHP